MEEGADVMEVFAAEAEDRMEDARRVLGPGVPPAGSPDWHTLFLHAHTFKSLGGSLGLDRVEAVAHELCLVLLPLDQDGAVADDVARERVRRGFGELRLAIEDACSASPHP